jgi:branched-chain amino acid transport system ATP-binding protein
MLELSGIRSGYGGVTILKNVNLTVEAEIFAVLGANGAGKSTLMKTIARLLTLESGTLRFLGDDVSQVPPNKLVEMGISIVPQEANIFPNLTVRENLSLGTLFGARSRRARIDEVFDLFPDIAARANQKAGSLSGGEAQMVAFGRALAQEPRLMLLDEPTTGLSPRYVELLLSKVREIHENFGVAILLAEQNAVKALEVADRVLVLSLGTVYLDSPTAQTDLAAIQAGYHI